MAFISISTPWAGAVWRCYCIHVANMTLWCAVFFPPNWYLLIYSHLHAFEQPGGQGLGEDVLPNHMMLRSLNQAVCFPANKSNVLTAEPLCCPLVLWSTCKIVSIAPRYKFSLVLKLLAMFNKKIIKKKRTIRNIVSFFRS